MLKHIYDQNGHQEIAVEKAEPQCGEDFCDSCGDCLFCYGGDPCYTNDDGPHFWVEYRSQEGHAD